MLLTKGVLDAMCHFVECRVYRLHASCSVILRFSSGRSTQRVSLSQYLDLQSSIHAFTNNVTNS